jgi:hypothetical protein
VKMCESPMMCQGKRQDRHCDVDHGTCANTGEPVDDDSSCVAMPTGLDCGGNFAQPCSGAVETPSPMAPGDCVPCTRVPTCSGPGTPPLGATTDGAACSRLCSCTPGPCANPDPMTNGGIGCTRLADTCEAAPGCTRRGSRTTSGAGTVVMRTIGCMGGPGASCVAGRCGP